jgi:class 3 adenylate cyclase
MANHLTTAGAAEAAIPLWQKAGELALGRMALTEAILHLDRGLEIVTTLAHSRDGTVGVTGDTVNPGVRLKTLATDDAILLSSETARHVNAYVKLQAPDSVDLDGSSALAGIRA